MLTIKSLTRKLIWILILSFVVINVLTSFSNYYHSKILIEKNELSRLKSIAISISHQLDAVQHQMIVEKYFSSTDTSKVYDDMYYRGIEKFLTEIQKDNNLETEIYTLFKDPNGDNKFYFGVVSNKKRYFKNTFHLHPEELVIKFEEGSVLPEYKDENGIWLSAFAPLKDKQGKTLAVIQVDKEISSFMKEVYNHTMLTVLKSLIIFILVGLVVWIFLRKILLIESYRIEQIETTTKKLQLQTKNVTDSINYSRHIQKRVLTSPSKISNFIPSSFVINKPRDIVSGDFLWTFETDEHFYIGLFDCTGHGVPGAMLSIVGHFSLNEIVLKNPNLPTCQLLKELHVIINKNLNTSDEETHDGMDACLCKFDKKLTQLEFAGANLDLFLKRNEEVLIFKGIRKGIGGYQFDKAKRDFTHQKIDLEKGDRLFLTTDGYLDQFGGSEEKKLGKSEFIKLINDISSLDEMSQSLDSFFEKWKSNQSQLDDVTVLGLEC